MSQLARVLGGVAGLIATLLLVPAGPLVSVVAVLGLGVLLVGGHRRRRRSVSFGAVVLLVAALLASIVGRETGTVLLAGLSATLAWDATEYGLTLREQLGPEAETRRVVFAHVGSTGLVAATLASLAYVGLLVAQGRLPAILGVAFVAGALLLALALPMTRGTAG